MLVRDATGAHIGDNTRNIYDGVWTPSEHCLHIIIFISDLFLISAFSLIMEFIFINSMLLVSDVPQ